MVKYNTERDKSTKTKRLTANGCLKNIIKEVKSKNSIPEYVIFDKHKICQRLWIGDVYSDGCGGHNYHILPMDSTIIKPILQMARIRRCLTPTQGLALVNSMIDGTTVQSDIMKLYKKYCPSYKLGTVGSGCWKGFRKKQTFCSFKARTKI